MKFTNPLKVNVDDTIGTVIIKKAAEGYVRTAFTGLVGLGVITVGVMKLNDIADNSQDEEVEEELSEDEKVEEFDKQKEHITRTYGSRPRGV